MPVVNGPAVRRSIGCLNVVVFLIASILCSQQASADGEPAEDFLNLLRAGKYFDMASAYLDRLPNVPGVDAEFLSAIDLEKAQTFIDAAYASRNSKSQTENFESAEKALQKFLAGGESPRKSEARLRLGKIQMVRGAQLLAGEPDDKKRAAARKVYEEAARTFNEIVEDLRAKLTKMQGAKIDADSDPDAAEKREVYKAEFLEAMMRAGEAYRYAAETYPNPAKQGKKLLESALKQFSDLSDKYDNYVQGAMAYVHRGLVQEQLGKQAKAVESFTLMLETVEADSLRDAKFQAASGLLRHSMSQSPPKYQEAITRATPMLKNVRPNEKRLASVGELQAALASAHIARSKDKGKQKPADMKRSESDAKQLLLKAVRIPGDHVADANDMLASMGIDKNNAPDEPLPTAEDPADFEDALKKAQQLFEASEQYAASISELEKGGDKEQLADLEKQLSETRAIAIVILRRGLSMINSESDVDLVNQGRQILTYLLYQAGRYRESSVLGYFLARNAPASEMGLRGGLLSLNSLQMLLKDDTTNGRLISKLENLGAFLSSSWPDDPQAASAKNVLIGLALEGEKWDDARKLVSELPAGPEKARSQRLLGQFMWAEAVAALQKEDDAKADQMMRLGQADLKTGLGGITKGLADQRDLKAALVLAKIDLKFGNAGDAAKTLNHPNYGPVKLIGKLGKPDKAFAIDLYSTQLQVLVQQMTADGSDTDALLKKALQAMEQLRKSVKGPDSAKKLAGIYLRLARNIRDQLDKAPALKRAKLISAFRVFLEQVAKTSKDEATLQWIGQTLVQLAESSMENGQQADATQTTELLETAIATFQQVEDLGVKSETLTYQVGRAQRMAGQYGDAIKSFTELLSQKPMMIDAQVEAALAYEQWAAKLPPKFAPKSYQKAIGGAKPAADGKNAIWGWGQISQLTSSAPQYRPVFFDARYHLALCRFLMAKSSKNPKLVETAASDITKVAALYPALGGDDQRRKFDALLKQIQKEMGAPPKGLGKAK